VFTSFWDLKKRWLQRPERAFSFQTFSAGYRVAVHEHLELLGEAAAAATASAAAGTGVRVGKGGGWTTDVPATPGGGRGLRREGAPGGDSAPPRSLGTRRWMGGAGGREGKRRRGGGGCGARGARRRRRVRGR